MRHRPIKAIGARPCASRISLRRVVVRHFGEPIRPVLFDKIEIVILVTHFNSQCVYMAETRMRVTE